mgnify:CR=1 FL=1
MKTSRHYFLALFFSLIFIFESGFLVIGHRGNPSKYPEETIQSDKFIQYFQENLEYLELEGFKVEKETDICAVDLQLDLSMMKRMINNICSNILKYAKKESPVYLEISIKQGNLKIVFENEKKKDIQQIESNKIGLKSVKRIVEMHHGQFFVQDLKDTFTLIITLPYN